MQIKTLNASGLIQTAAVSRNISLPPVGFWDDPYWINNQEINMYQIWLPGLQTLDELSAASWKYSIGLWNTSKPEQHFHHPAGYLRPSSSTISGPKSLVPVTQELRLWFTMVLSVFNNLWWGLLSWTLSSCRYWYQLANLPQNQSPFPQVTMFLRLSRCCPEMIQRISFILTAQLFVILSRSSKAINCTEGEHFKAH